MSGDYEVSPTGGLKEVGGKLHYELVPEMWADWLSATVEPTNPACGGEDDWSPEMALRTWWLTGDFLCLIKAAQRAVDLHGSDDFAADFEQLVRVMQFGAYDKKPRAYGPLNWTKGTTFSGLYAAATRHGGDMNGTAPDSGLPHWAHFVCNCLMIASQIAAGVGVNDRAQYNLQAPTVTP